VATPAAGDPIPLPVEVMLARQVEQIPAAGQLPGGCAYEPKFDGYRLIILTGPVRLQTRSGRIITHLFPEVAAAAARLPDGSVLDGELVLWRDGQVDFGALQRRALSAAGKHASAGMQKTPLPANVALFDLLAYEGTDWRERPYEERRSGLIALLAPIGPPLQVTPVTTDPREAADWYRNMHAVGIEGLVVKGLAQQYRPGRREWLKMRHAEPRDAMAIGFTGPRARPDALVLDLGEGPVVSAPLTQPVLGQIARLLACEPAAGVSTSGTARAYTPLLEPLPVEVRQGTTRHTRTVITRLRLGQ
jgi:ATP-dependent DNA ligase